MSKQITAHVEHALMNTDTHVQLHTQNVLGCQANMNSCENLGLIIFIEIVVYEKLISAMPHVIILNTVSLSACDGNKSVSSA